MLYVVIIILYLMGAVLAMGKIMVLAEVKFIRPVPKAVVLANGILWPVYVVSLTLATFKLFKHF